MNVLLEFQAQFCSQIGLLFSEDKLEIVSLKDSIHFLINLLAHYREVNIELNVNLRCFASHRRREKGQKENCYRMF